MKASDYVGILTTTLMDSLEYYGYSPQDIYFQQDNDPKHTSKLARQWFKDNNFKCDHTFNWPSQSPDLNPIEHVWHHLKLKLSAYDIRAKGVHELWDRVEKEWSTFTAEDFARRKHWNHFSTHCTNHHGTDAMATPASVEALRLEALGASSSTPGLTAMSTSLLRAPRLMDTTTNKSYKRGQTLFIEWALAQDISLTSFTDVHLTNFLSEMFQVHGYNHSTICLFRSAVTHLHEHPSSLRSSDIVNSLIASLKSRAPPQPIHRPTVDMSPSLKAVRLIDINDLSTALPHLQQKLAFLLGMAAFLRPSDLRRIDFAAAYIEIERNRQYLSFQVVAPKERRAGRRIIRPFRLYNHQDPSLCPVATFQAIKDRLAHLIPQPTVTSFFVNTNMTTQIVKVTTISSWIRRLIRLSTSEPRVSCLVINDVFIYYFIIHLSPAYVRLYN
ncbi:hypothetical protein G6F66_012584 [Rhizopus arrhizus]|nr:hypothetical protein G6F66_012584 [Rhizopus arrhizus]